MVRYERSRPPRGQALEKFRSLAEEHGLHDIARTFRYAMGEAVENAVLHDVMDTLWDNRQHLTEWPILAGQLEIALRALVEQKRANPDLIPESHVSLETQLVHLRLLLFGTAEDQLAAAAARIAAEQPALSYPEAYEQAFNENPALYKRYLQERADAGRGTHAEDSLAVHGTRQQAARKKKESDQK